MDSIKNLNILVIDDFKENLIDQSAILSAEGFKVMRAQSGEEALRNLQLNTFDLVLLDVQEPKTDGFDVAEKMSQNSILRQVPIIFLTSKPDSIEDKVSNYNFETAEYLTKPLDANSLILKVKNLLSLALAKGRLENSNEPLKVNAKNSELLYEDLFNNNPDEIVIVNESGYITKINRTGKLSMGVLASELIGISLENLPFTYKLSNSENLIFLVKSIIANKINEVFSEISIICANGKQN